jgi:hypothetical protein
VPLPQGFSQGTAQQTDADQRDFLPSHRAMFRSGVPGFNLKL